MADIFDTDVIDAHYEDVESLYNLDDCNTIQCVENVQRIVLCKMYLKYLIGSCDARKNCKIFKINVCYLTLILHYNMFISITLIPVNI